jgi:hypothetical protein
MGTWLEMEREIEVHAMEVETVPVCGDKRIHGPLRVE